MELKIINHHTIVKNKQIIKSNRVSLLVLIFPILFRKQHRMSCVPTGMVKLYVGVLDSGNDQAFETCTNTP